MPKTLAQRIANMEAQINKLRSNEAAAIEQARAITEHAALFSAVDYAWAAGVIDGEGCLFIARHLPTAKNGVKVPYYTLGLKVTMGHEPTILRLRELFGSGSKHKVEQVGWNPAYTWIVAADFCNNVLDCIEPYVLTKKLELAVAREFLALPGWHGGNHRGPKSEEYQQREYALWDRMRRLKPRTAYRLAKVEHAKN